MSTIKQQARYKVLSSVIQRSFGRSSEEKYPTHFLTLDMPMEGLLVAKFMMIVNFGHQNVQMELRKKYMAEGVETITKTLKRVEEEYKKAVEDKSKLLEPKIEPYEAPAPKTVSLKLNPSSISETIEYVNISLYNPRKTAYYRLQATVEVA